MLVVVMFGDKLGKASPEFGVLFAFQVLPIVIFIASLFSVLYYLGVMQVVIRVMAQVMRRTMGGSGAESTNVAASIFMGQTEAPLTIRPRRSGTCAAPVRGVLDGGSHIFLEQRS